MRKKQEEFYKIYHKLGRTGEAAEVALGEVYSIKTWSKAKKKEQLDKLFSSNEGKLYLESLEKTKKVRKKLEKNSGDLEKNSGDLEKNSGDLEKSLEKTASNGFKKNKGGRPTKFNENTVRQAGILCSKHGYTDQQLAGFFSVTEQTVNNWKKAHPKFFESLKESKDVADDLVQRALFERATGYEHPEDKIFNNNGEALVVPTIKRYPPDVVAGIFWLKNRRPEEFRDKPEPKTNERPIEIKLVVEKVAPDEIPAEYLDDD